MGVRVGIPASNKNIIKALAVTRLADDLIGARSGIRILNCPSMTRPFAGDGLCHAPWLLIETGIARGRKMTSYKSIKTDVMNAGGEWEDSSVVTDNGV